MGGKRKRGCSGYYFFIQEHLKKLEDAGTPYSGGNASQDFAILWKKLSSKERENYENRATVK